MTDTPAETTPAKPVSRVDYLRAQHAEALHAVFLERETNPRFRRWAEKGAGALFDRLRAADPTPKAACLQWLIRRALDGALPAEDWDRAKETLATFERFKGRLDASQRDLGSYRALGAVWAAVGPMAEAGQAASKAEEDRRQRAVAMAESDLIFDGTITGTGSGEGGRLLVGIPKSRRAAQWWGRGTQWCTAAANNNMFSSYSKDGPLVAFILPDGRKYQGHAPSNQFMDANDSPIAFARALDGWSDAVAAACPSAWLAMSAIRARSYRYTEVMRLPEAPTWADAEHYEDAVLRFGMPLDRVPVGMRTHAACLHAVRMDASAFSDVPSNIMTEEIARAAVAKKGSLLRKVPESMRSTAVFQAAVAADGSMLREMPEHLIDLDLCRRITAKQPHFIEYVPQRFVAELAPEVLRADGMVLSNIPRALRTPDLCRIAVENYPNAIQEVPPPLVDRAMAIQALRRGADLRCIPLGSPASEILRTGSAAERDPMVLPAVRNNPMNLEYVVESGRTKAVCKLALSAPADAEFCDQVFDGVPTTLFDDDLMRAAVRGGPWRLARICILRPDLAVPEDVLHDALFRCPQLAKKPQIANLMNEKTWMIAVRGDGRLYENVPHHLRTDEMRIAAVRSDGSMLEKVAMERPDLVTKDLVIAAVHTSHSVDRDVIERWKHDRDFCEALLDTLPTWISSCPKEHVNKALCLKVASHQAGAEIALLRHIPEDMRDRDVCLAAVQMRGENLASVPDGVIDKEICLRAVTTWGGALEHVPTALRDRDVCMAAVRSQGWAIRAVPEALRDIDMLRIAVAQRPAVAEEVLASVQPALRHQFDLVTAPPAAVTVAGDEAPALDEPDTAPGVAA